VRNTDLKPGDVVQLAPDTSFPGCFMMVTEPKLWGAQGFIAIPKEIGKPPAHAYYRALWGQMELVGRAAFVPEEQG
jgi:hypothetical protein